jgi:DNA (cytosine-5)-methyltransferase 1
LTELVNKPPYLILENVDRLLKSPSGRRGRDFAVMLRSLSELGYNVEWKVIDASEWGFPQRRKRVFIVGYHRSISDKYLGLLESVFPFESKLSSREFELDADIETISNDFGVGDLVSKFGNDGHYINGVVYTSDVKYEKIEGNVLADVLEPIECVSSDYHLKDIDFEKWVYLKGAKKIVRTSKNGHSYNFAEGAMSFPDSLNKPSRTIITSEGGATPSRFKHVILQDNVHRRLTPKELERLNGFPDDWTRVEGINDSRRSFFMGNALVVGIIEMIADALSEYHYQSTISRLSK